MYLVAYDIASDRIRTKVAKRLENYGKRVQYSLFECDLNRKEYKHMYGELIDLTEKMEDGNIRIYQLDKDIAQQVVTIGDPAFVSIDLKQDVIFI